MSRQNVEVSCPKCFRRYSLSLDVEKLRRLRQRAQCGRCGERFDVGERLAAERPGGATEPPRRAARRTRPSTSGPGLPRPPAAPKPPPPPAIPPPKVTPQRVAKPDRTTPPSPHRLAPKPPLAGPRPATKWHAAPTPPPPRPDVPSQAITEPPDDDDLTAPFEPTEPPSLVATAVDVPAPAPLPLEVSGEAATAPPPAARPRSEAESEPELTVEPAPELEEDEPAPGEPAAAEPPAALPELELPPAAVESALDALFTMSEPPLELEAAQLVEELDFVPPPPARAPHVGGPCTDEPVGPRRPRSPRGRGPRSPRVPAPAALERRRLIDRADGPTARGRAQRPSANSA